MRLVSALQTGISRTFFNNISLKRLPSFIVISVVLSLLAPMVGITTAQAAQPPVTQVTLTYSAGTGGTITGVAPQHLASGGDEPPVGATQLLVMFFQNGMTIYFQLRAQILIFEEA